MSLLHALTLALSLPVMAREMSVQQTPEERAAEEDQRRAEGAARLEEFRLGWERAEVGLREEIRERIRMGTLDGLRESLAERRFDLPGAFETGLFAELDRALALRDSEGREALVAHAVGLHALALPGLRRMALDDCDGSETDRYMIALAAAECAVHLGDHRAAIELLAHAASLFPAEWPITETPRKLRKFIEDFAPRHDDPEAWLAFVDGYWLGPRVRQRDAEETLLEVRARFAGKLSPAQLARLDRTVFTCRLQLADLVSAEDWIATLAADVPADTELVADCRLALAVAYAGRCARAEAVARYRAILAAYPNSRSWGNAQFNLAVLLEQSGDLAGAIRAFEAILAREVAASPGGSLMETHFNPTHEAAERISTCYVRLGKLEQALAYARRAQALPFVTWCGTCAESERASDTARVERLAKLLEKR